MTGDDTLTYSGNGPHTKPVSSASSDTAQAIKPTLTSNDSGVDTEDISGTDKIPHKLYWQFVENEIELLLKAKKITPYDAEALIWFHQHPEESNDDFYHSVPESLHNKKWFHKNKPVLAIAAKGSNTLMTLTSFLFAVTSAAASFLLDFFHLNPLVTFIANLINSTTWDGSDSLFGLIIAIDLFKNGVSFDGALNTVMNLLLLPTTIAYTLTLPNLQVITNALASTTLTIGLNVLFAASMWVCCLIDIRHALKGNTFIKEKEAELGYLKLALKELQPAPGTVASEDSKTKITKLNTRITVLENLISTKKHQVTLHKKNAWLWGASATLMTGSAVLTTLLVLGVVASSAATMGIIPGVLSLACAAFALWRWHVNRSANPRLSSNKSGLFNQARSDNCASNLVHDSKDADRSSLNSWSSAASCV